MKKILTKRQNEFLVAFQKSELSKYFYWSGGTLLSYFYLQHRFSEDLDFFCDDLISDEFIAVEIFKIKKDTHAIKVLQYKRFNRYQFVFEYPKEAMKIEFAYYPFPSIEPKKILPGFDLKIDSLKDIAANKTHAAFERSEPKDVFDLYFILQKGGFPFIRIFEWVEKKFGVEIDPIFFGAKILESVSQLQKISPLVFSDKKNYIYRIEAFFKREIFSYMKKKI